LTLFYFFFSYLGSAILHNYMEKEKEIKICSNCRCRKPLIDFESKKNNKILVKTCIRCRNKDWQTQESQGIYMLVFKDSGIYVGSSSNLCQRKNQHFYELRKGTHTNPNLQQRYNESGFPFFVFVKYAETSRLRYEEQNLINALGNTLNITRAFVPHDNCNTRREAAC